MVRASGAAGCEIDAVQAALEHGHLKLHTTVRISHDRGDGLSPYRGLRAAQFGAAADRNGHEAGGQRLVKIVASADLINGYGSEGVCKLYQCLVLCW